MNRSHEYDDENDIPPPPPWWHGLLITVLFIAFLIICIALFTGCVCTLTCRPDVPAIIEIIETK